MRTLKLGMYCLSEVEGCRVCLIAFGGPPGGGEHPAKPGLDIG
jgi:hypothetical protein